MKKVAFLWQPKYVSPFGDNKLYLTPRIKDQQGEEWNYIVVCCAPSWNGLYRWPRKEIINLRRWNNHGKWCLYVPIDICEFVKPLNEIERPDIKKKAFDTQFDWFTYSRPKKWPFWMLGSEGSV